MATTRTGRSTARLPEPVERVTPYQRLKEAIRSGELRPGQQLVESTLATWCEVSRTPIREALSRLAHDGLVERSDRGLVVRQRSPEEILDIYEARIALEATAARLAAERRTSPDLILLRRGLAVTNQQFHAAVWRASHNAALVDLLERLDLHLAGYPAEPGGADQRERALSQHVAIVDAIEARDGVGAERIAAVHFVEARDARLHLFDDLL